MKRDVRRIGVTTRKLVRLEAVLWDKDGNASNTEMALAYYKAGIEGNRPDYVPARIRLRERVHGDGPFYGTFADAGEHDCSSNQWGALSVRATNGRMLGVKPKEFEPVSWRPNGGGKPRGE